MFMTNLLTITPWPTMSAAILLVLLIAALYLARHTAHQAIHAVTSALARGFRLASHSVAHAEARLAARNREVLLAAGRDAKERMVEREFARVADTARKDLANYPDMHRRLSEAILRIEEDQEKAVEVPPEAPGWAKAVEVIAKLDARNAGADILADIHKSMVKAHGEAMEDYRKASGERHALLRKMMPDWRMIQETLGRVNKSVTSVIERSLVIDRHMQEYETIVRGEDRALSVLSSSSLVNFFVSLLVLGVATAGAAINFTLIARPMAEMVGGTSFIGMFRTADIAALVIIMVEISMGLFLMESLRITRLFPDRRVVRQNARAHDGDYVHDPAADGEYRSGPRVHARSAAAGRARDHRAAAWRECGSAGKRAPLDHHDGTDGHGIRPAIRARLCRHPARDIRALAAHRGWPYRYRGAAGARAHPSRSR